MKVNKLSSMLLAAFVSTSCSDIYDNIKDFSPEERIYPAKFDIVTVSYGYERVEFDFGTQGRVPASQMYLGKAEKTIVECDGKPLVFDSICSWVNITGLTESRIYKFKIYTEDRYDNPSIAQEISVTPFTSEDVAALALTPPSILESTATVFVEWKNPIESDLYRFLDYSYEYTDRNSQKKSGGGDDNLPNFFVENIENAKDVPVKFTARVLPNYQNKPLIEAIDLPVPMTIRISDNAKPVVFLKSPAAATTVDPEEGQFPVQFNWIKVDEATGYELKFSTDPTFPNTAGVTTTMNMGSGDTYSFTQTDAHSMVNSLFTAAGRSTVYWTIGATGNTTQVNEQVRNMSAVAGVKNLGRQWTFDNPSDLFAAVGGGNALVPVETGGSITAIAGPSATDRAIRIPAGSYLKCDHGLAPTGYNPRVNRYSVMFDVRVPDISTRRSFMNTHDNINVAAPTADPDFFLSNGSISSGGYNDTDVPQQSSIWTSVFKMTPNAWSRVMYTVDLGGNQVRYYVNGIELFTPTVGPNINPSGFSNYKGLSLDPAGVLLFAGSSGTIDVANVQFYDGVPSAWERYRLGGVGTRQITDNRASAWAFVDNHEMGALQSALDNNYGTWAASTWPPPPPYDVTPDTYWFTIDLKQRQTLASYTMQGRCANWDWAGMHSGIGPYYLEISDDNKTWTRIGANTTANGSGSDVTEVYFDPDDLPSGRYLKVTQPAAPERGGNALAFIVGEIFIFGPK